MLMRPASSVISVVLCVLVTACAGNQRAASHATPSTAPTRVRAPGPSSTALSALANGRSIFQTGRDLRGALIVAMPPPPFTSCAACHRADGAGGLHLPGGSVSADLRHSALVSGQKTPYTLALLERAISTGVDDQGHLLSPVMPRWRLTQQDLHDVASYVLDGLSKEQSK